MTAIALPAASPTLDVRNVLWLLAAMTFVVAPHVARVPAWVSIFCLVVVAWRGWISWSALRFPPRWVVVVLTLGATAATFLSYGRLFGRDAGVTLLIVMAAMKLLEMRTQREVVLAVFLGFFLVMTNFLFSQAIPLGLYLLLCVWIFVATLVGFHRVGRTPTLRERLVPSGLLLLQALPLMVVFFLLFPRVQGPLWALPQDARAGITGLSDSMAPGNLSSLIQSEALAFRVQFEDKMPPYQLLYWRGPVMWAFDGRAWKMAEFSPMRDGRAYKKAERPVKYTMTVEPHGKHWLFALDVPEAAPPGASMRHDLQLRSVRPVDTKLRYDMTSFLDYEYGERLGDGLKEYALRLDETRNPRAIALGRQWRVELGDPEKVVNRAFQYYNREFTYTLEPPLLGERDPYDEFLFESKRGFCEHYAGSFAVIMRAAGIPTRIVTGYQGGEVNPFNNELIVRQADAHAWTEIWLEGKGWVRVDPTAAVSPLRVEGGVNAALGPIGAMSSFIAADRLGVLAKARFAWQMINSQWDQWVVGYNVDKQRQFLAQLGLGAQVDWRTLALWLVGGSFLVGGLMALGLLIRDLPKRGEASLVAWRRFCAKLAAAGLARASHEGPLDYLARVVQARPELAEAASDITRRYVDARYGLDATPDDLRELGRRVRAFRVA
jgi:protein-glutamine gamma-glutamyltransferase